MSSPVRAEEIQQATFAHEATCRKCRPRRRAGSLTRQKGAGAGGGANEPCLAGEDANLTGKRDSSSPAPGSKAFAFMVDSSGQPCCLGSRRWGRVGCKSGLWVEKGSGRSKNPSPSPTPNSEALTAWVVSHHEEKGSVHHDLQGGHSGVQEGSCGGEVEGWKSRRGIF